MDYPKYLMEEQMDTKNEMQETKINEENLDHYETADGGDRTTVFID